MKQYVLFAIYLAAIIVLTVAALWFTQQRVEKTPLSISVQAITPEPMNRKIIQISTPQNPLTTGATTITSGTTDILHALASDGTVWRLLHAANGDISWKQFPALPPENHPAR